MIIPFIWYFFIFAFVGWCAEVAFAAIVHGRFVNRGFLSGPACPIYGVAALSVVLLLRPVSENIVLLYVSSVVVTSALEWGTGFVLDKLFHTKWWDYSDEKFNLNGYVCLKFSLVWGLACLFLMKFLYPLMAFLISFIPKPVSIILLAVLSGVFAADLVVTVIALAGLRKKVRLLESISQKLCEGSELIGQGVSDEMLELRELYDAALLERNVLTRRLITAADLQLTRHNDQISAMRERFLQLRLETKKTIKQHDENVREIYEEDKKSNTFAGGLCLTKLFWLFMVGNFAGFLLETLYCLATSHKLELRIGVIYGPFIPVYGFGAVVITLCLYRLYKKRDLWIFLLSMLIGSLFEYTCSLFQEVAFGTVSWDYSNATLNLGGRTSILFAFFWGLLGLIWVKELYPILSRLIEKIPKRLGTALTILLAVLISCDMLISSLAVGRQTERRKGIPPDNKIDVFLDKHYPDSFLKKIYPNMKPAETIKIEE